MATETTPGRKSIPRGRVQFEVQGKGKRLAVHVDRKGFRRLLDTLERLAETGVHQSFRKSGRKRAGGRSGGSKEPGDSAEAVAELVFHIEDDH